MLEYEKLEAMAKRDELETCNAQLKSEINRLEYVMCARTHTHAPLFVCL